MGYTLSWTWRKFEDLNDGEKYPAKYDRRHDISVVAMYELNQKDGNFLLCLSMDRAMPPRFPKDFI